jgi:hypothetical protein
VLKFFTIARPLTLLGLLAAAPAWAQFQTKLAPATVTAFDDYRKGMEAKLDWRATYPQLKPGEVKVAPARGDGSTDIKDGIVHDWTAAVLVPGANVKDGLQLLQNYPAYKTVYTPEVTDSKVLSRDGDRWRVFLQLMKKKVLTVMMNGEFDVEYRDLGGGRWSMVSRSTRLAELDEGRELPLGTGHGFLWRLNAYWLIEPRPEGLYLECRSLSLSRDVPFGLGLVVKPFVTSVPPESLRDTMQNTVRALRSAVARRIAEENPTIAQQEVNYRGQ